MKPTRNAVAGFKAAKQTIECPAHCTLHGELAEQFFRDLTACRANWLDVHLAQCVNLANLMARAAENADLILTEGEVLKNSRGDLVCSPRVKILASQQRLILAMSNSLQVSTSATIGRARDNKNANAAKGYASDAMDGMEDSLLIPGLRSVKH